MLIRSLEVQELQFKKHTILEKMSDSSDTSSIIFVAEQKNVQVDVQPPPPTPENQNSTSSNFVPDTQGEVNNSSTSENAVSIIPETGK